MYSWTIKSLVTESKLTGRRIWRNIDASLNTISVDLANRPISTWITNKFEPQHTVFVVGMGTGLLWLKSTACVKWYDLPALEEVLDANIPDFNAQRVELDWIIDNSPDAVIIDTAWPAAFVKFVLQHAKCPVYLYTISNRVDKLLNSFRLTVECDIAPSERHRVRPLLYRVHGELND